MAQQTILISIPLDQLESLIDNSVSNALLKFSDQQKEKPQSEYFTRKETANKLHISLGTLDSYTRLGILNAVKVGHRVLYKVEDINQSLVDKINVENLKDK